MWKGKYGQGGVVSRSLSLNETEVDGPFVDTASVWGYERKSLHNLMVELDKWVREACRILLINYQSSIPLLKR